MGRSQFLATALIWSPTPEIHERMRTLFEHINGWIEVGDDLLEVTAPSNLLQQAKEAGAECFLQGEVVPSAVLEKQAMAFRAYAQAFMAPPSPKTQQDGVAWDSPGYDRP